MPKVMIEMEMPKGCGWCRFYTEDENYLSYCVAKSSERCMIPEEDLAYYRPPWCPLCKVEECDMTLTKEQTEELRKEICARTGMPYSVLFGEKRGENMGVLLLIALCIVGLVFGIMTLIFPHPLVPTFTSAKPKKPEGD